MGKKVSQKGDTRQRRTVAISVASSPKARKSASAWPTDEETLTRRVAQAASEALALAEELRGAASMLAAAPPESQQERCELITRTLAEWRGLLRRDEQRTARGALYGRLALAAERVAAKEWTAEQGVGLVLGVPSAPPEHQAAALATLLAWPEKAKAGRAGKWDRMRELVMLWQHADHSANALKVEHSHWLKSQRAALVEAERALSALGFPSVR